VGVEIEFIHYLSFFILIHRIGYVQQCFSAGIIIYYTVWCKTEQSGIMYKSRLIYTYNICVCMYYIGIE